MFSSLIQSHRMSTAFASMALAGGVLAQDSEASKQPLLPKAQVSIEEDAQDDIRSMELSSRQSDVTFIRVDEQGQPIVRMDLHFGGELPATEAELRDLVLPFGFGTNEEQAKGDPSGARTRLVANPGPPDGQADLVHFEPEADLVIAVRHLELDTAISCSLTRFVTYNGSRSSGTRLNWYVYADAVSGVAGPSKGSYADPDTYLYYKSGLSWYLLSSSGSYTYPDAVGGYSPSCSTKRWRFRVYMYAGGSFGARASWFSAW